MLLVCLVRRCGLSRRQRYYLGLMVDSGDAKRGAAEMGRRCNTVTVVTSMLTMKRHITRHTPTQKVKSAVFGVVVLFVGNEVHHRSGGRIINRTIR